MRTIRRKTFQLNPGKQAVLDSVIKAYAKEKQYWLSVLQKPENFQYIHQAKKVRDKAVSEKYQSPNQLQARMWKLALQDAADTLHKHWSAIFDKVKRYIFTNQALSATQKHYAYWLLSDYHRSMEMFAFRTPRFKNLMNPERNKVVHYLNRIMRKHKGLSPKVKMARSFCLDPDCYSIFVHKQTQYISLMTLTPRQRVILPLLGHTPIQGNIRIVKDRISTEIHYTADIKQRKTHNQEVLALDFGYSEIFTDSEGDKYGTQFGQIITRASDSLKEKMQKRHKLHALQKKYLCSNSMSKKIKSEHILKNNLGRQKLNKSHQKYQDTLNQKINSACNQLFTKNIGILVTENLSHVFSYQRGKNWNRRLSAWVRGQLRERVEFKALVKGFDHKQVNAAYSSQTCLLCDYVGRLNRKGDKFQCQYCGYEDDADIVAAKNLKGRYYDPEITRYMPYREVKKILLARFHRRLETEQSGTVSGRILDTTYKVPTFGGQSESEFRKQGNVYI